MNLKAVIVEDEPIVAQSLIEKLKLNCPQVEIIGKYESSYDAIREIPKVQPHLVFLDINLDSLNGFDVLDRLQHLQFETIFTTDYDTYVIKAIRAKALDYLLKPIDRDELVRAVNEAWKNSQKKTPSVAPKTERIAIPTSHGYSYILPAEIVYCESANTSTIIHFKERKEIKVSRTLKETEEELLARPNFIRIHRQFLINRDYLQEFSRKDGGFVILSTNKILPVSRNKEQLI